MERLTKRHPNGVVGISECRYYNYDDFQKMANKLADYEDIGTVSELRELKEKATPKKVAYQGEHEKCPSCGSFHVYWKYCSKCGQAVEFD